MFEDGSGTCGPQRAQVTVPNAAEVVPIDSMTGKADRLHGWQWLHALHDNAGL
ncbi:hypothetical protein GCM10009813_36350 [Brevibacterium marinum]